MKTNSWTQKRRKILKKQTLSVINAGPPDTEFQFLLDKKKNQLKLTKRPWKYVNFDLLEGKS